MTKRMLILLLLAVLALAACGGQDAATPQPTEVPPAEADSEPAELPTEVPPTEVPPTEAAAEEQVTEATAEETTAPGSMVEGMDHTADPNLVDITWEWVRRDPNGNSSPEITIENPENYILFFNEDGTFNAKLDCNSGSGVYATPSVGSIFMELGPTTLAACPPESHAGEMSGIFGGAVQNYQLRDDGNTLVLVWVAGGPLDYYRNADAPEAAEEMAGQEVVESIPEDAIQLDLNGLADSFQWEVIPGMPLPSGPGAQGFPPHILITFDGVTPDDAIANQLQRIYIFPTQAYVDLYGAQGNQRVSNEIVRLGQLIATADDRTAPPDSPMPLLPPPNNFMDRWAQFLDLNFGSGDGVRYVSDSPYRQAIGVWTNETTGYYYQGLSTDQAFYVSMFWPVSTAALPNTADDASEEQQAAAANPDTYETYKQETIDALNALAAADFSPDLASLDAMAASLTFPLPSEAPAGEEAAAGEETPADEETAVEEEAAESGEEGGFLTPPGAGEPTATVTAPDGVFVRSGPGTQYADIAVAANGETGKIVGVSEDGAWWVVEVPLSVSADQQGWVSADWVEAANADGVPVIPAPDEEAAEPGEPALTGVTWQWLSTTTPADAITVADPSRYTILFNTDGTAAVKADCNNIIADYSTDSSSISITLGPTTQVFCGEDSQDVAFKAGLSAAAIYFFQDGDLYMDLIADGGTMRFTPGTAAPAPEPTPEAETPTSPAEGIVFNLVSYGPEGQEQSLIEGTSITATFADQQVTGNAGCNDYAGLVTPVSDYFTISGIALTRQACAEPVGVMEQEQAYVAALASTAGYQWQQDIAGGSLITGARLFYSLDDGTTGYLNFVAQ